MALPYGQGRQLEANVREILPCRGTDAANH
jgi:hypothetical protein